MKPGLVNGRWELILPDAIADWDAITGWERRRFASMEARLRPGMRLFDIGAEHGWISAILASFVGAENMVLVEPSEDFWRNIRLIWEHNGLELPLACVQALVGASCSDTTAPVVHGAWPACSSGEECPPGAYRYLHEPDHVAKTPVMSLDWFVGATGIVPDAITVDIEGAETEALLGARAVLREHHPLVWVSIHPDLMERDYGATPAFLHAFMAQQGYAEKHLGTDHEEHWLFS